MAGARIDLLSFGGRVMEPGRTLESYGIGDESMLNLALRIAGGTEESEEEAPSEHNEALFYDPDTDDTASCDSLATYGSSLYDHREARVQEMVDEDFDSQATTLEWGGLFDTDPANEPYDDHGSSDDDDDNDNHDTTEPPAHHGEPSPVTSYQAGVGFAVAGQGLAVQLGETPVLSESTLPVTGYQAGGVDSESDGGESELVCQESRLSLSSSSLRLEPESCEPPSLRRRITIESGEFQVFVKPIAGCTVLLWVHDSMTVLELKDRFRDKIGWWLTLPENIRITLNGHFLNDEYTLAQHGISAQFTLRQVAGIGGGVSDVEMDEFSSSLPSFGDEDMAAAPAAAEGPVEVPPEDSRMEISKENSLLVHF
jgi:hypothetical protein